MSQIEKDKIVGYIYESHDYNSFKRMEGNRDVTAARVRKIRTSIENHGYILSPVGVNEKKEVVDGQGRNGACEELGLPIYYYIIPGATQAECVALNAYGDKWGITDYIKSYAEMGIDDYKNLLKLCELYNKLTLKVIIYAVVGKDNANDDIKGGRFKCSRDEFLKADRVLQKCMQLRKYISKIPGMQSCIYQALIFAILHCDLDEDRLFRCIEARANGFERIGTIKEALEKLSEIYNHKCRTERIYLYTEYDKFNRAKFPWYASKWSKQKLEGQEDACE